MKFTLSNKFTISANAFVVALLLTFPPLVVVPFAQAETKLGELEGRAAPVYLRRCVAGSNAGDLCKQTSECPGSSCPDRNVFNLQVQVNFTATAAELTSIENMITAGSASLFDATDGQAEIGTAFIYNGSLGATVADMLIHPTTNPVWWVASTGNWQVGGDMEVSINNVTTAVTNGTAGPTVAHEFMHLAFDPRDEYETKAPNCGADNCGTPGVSDSCWNCPDPTTIAAGATSCLMDRNPAGAELCWGQANPADLSDLSGGNHDATNVTEQSSCRSNRSCWDQVVWSYPNTILMPVGAPDPAANGAIVNPVNFVHLSTTNRVVLVLDESGSMNNEAPTRMDRLQVAANDFVALAENGTELGIVSFSTDADPTNGHASIAIASLGANRAAWTTAIGALSPGGWTNIGDSLDEAWNMIDTAGGVTANTYIVLMTDGVNNRPTPQSTADADLQAKIDFLLSAGVPVFVTCTGGDLTLDSQCAEIGNGTGGFYSDSADAAALPSVFAAFHEKISGREAIHSRSGQLRHFRPQRVFVEKDSNSVTFILQWSNPNASPYLLVVDPTGTPHKSLEMEQGRYVRVTNPVSGNWQMMIDPGGDSEGTYTASAFSSNSIHRFRAGTRYPTVRPGEPITLFAYPKSYRGPVSNPARPIFAMVEKPDGRRDRLMLWDQGRRPGRKGDDMADDAIYTGVYTNTRQKGAYTFHIYGNINRWRSSGDAHKIDRKIRSARFNRIATLSVAVSDPKDVTRKFEDGRGSKREQTSQSKSKKTKSSSTSTFPPNQVSYDVVGKGKTVMKLRSIRN